MIQSGQWEYSDDIRDNAIMFALEAQWRNTSLCLTRAEYELHHQTFRALGEYYRKIGARRSETLRLQNFIEEMQYGCKTIQGGGEADARPPKGILSEPRRAYASEGEENGESG